MEALAEKLIANKMPEKLQMHLMVDFILWQQQKEHWWKGW